MQATHFNDEDGNPAGGTSFGTGFAIGWQHGPLGQGEDRREPNGAFVEDIIKVCIDRLEYYQSTRFKCDYNAIAIHHLAAALSCLNTRTAHRQARGVEGTHEE